MTQEASRTTESDKCEPSNMAVEYAGTVRDLGPHDVLCGLVGDEIDYNQRQGNKEFQNYVDSLRQAYFDAPSSTKIEIARKVVNLVHQNGGRFLRYKDDNMKGGARHTLNNNGGNGDGEDQVLYLDIGTTLSVEKACKALRESSLNTEQISTKEKGEKEVSAPSSPSESSALDTQVDTMCNNKSCPSNSAMAGKDESKTPHKKTTSAKVKLRKENGSKNRVLWQGAPNSQQLGAASSSGQSDNSTDDEANGRGDDADNGIMKKTRAMGEKPSTTTNDKTCATIGSKSPVNAASETQQPRTVTATRDGIEMASRPIPASMGVDKGGATTYQQDIMMIDWPPFKCNPLEKPGVLQPLQSENHSSSASAARGQRVPTHRLMMLSNNNNPQTATGGAGRGDREVSGWFVDYFTNGGSSNASEEEEKEHWEGFFQEMVRFKDVFGHCCIPPSSCSPQPGYSKEEREHAKLADWVSFQRQSFREIRQGRRSATEEEKVRLTRLEALGFVFNYEEWHWNSKYEELVKFQKREEERKRVEGIGDATRKKRWKDKTEFAKLLGLALWVKEQRHLYKEGLRGKINAMPADRVKKLELLDLSWTAEIDTKSLIMSAESIGALSSLSSNANNKWNGHAESIDKSAMSSDCPANVADKNNANKSNTIPSSSSRRPATTTKSKPKKHPRPSSRPSIQHKPRLNRVEPKSLDEYGRHPDEVDSSDSAPQQLKSKPRANAKPTTDSAPQQLKSKPRPNVKPSVPSATEHPKPIPRASAKPSILPASPQGKAQISNRSLEVYHGPPDEDMSDLGGWPQGWIKSITERTGGSNPGRQDRYWYSPGGRKFRSLKEVRKCLEDEAASSSVDHGAAATEKVSCLAPQAAGPTKATASKEAPLTPRANDILFGKDVDTFNHEGNKQFEKMIAQFLDPFKDFKTRNEENRVLESIRSHFNRRGGRFLQRQNVLGDSCTDMNWDIMEPGKAMQEIKAALDRGLEAREKARTARSEHDPVEKMATISHFCSSREVNKT